MALRLPTLPRLAFYASSAFVGALSLLPSDALPSTEISDKLAHLLAYAALGLIGGATARNGNRAALSILGIVGFGTAIEILQMFAPGRHAELGDALADAAGALIGGAVALVLRRIGIAASAP